MICEKCGRVGKRGFKVYREIRGAYDLIAPEMTICAAPAACRRRTREVPGGRSRAPGTDKEG